MTNLRVEYASSSLIGTDYHAKITAAQHFCARLGWTLGIQIHNVTDLDWIERLAAAGTPLSYHAPLCSEYFLNLANAEFSYARQSFASTARIIRRFGPGLAVFHGFLMTDLPILAFNRERSLDECLAVARRDELCLAGSPFCSDFLDTPEYTQRLARVKQRLAQIAADFPDIQWCIENDFPVYGGGLLLAEPMAALDAPLCLDLSHLWVACLLLRRDYHRQIALLAASRRVRCVHLHANPLPLDTPVRELRDGHRSLATPNHMRLHDTVRLLRDNGVAHWVLETPEADLPDLETLAAWLA